MREPLCGVCEGIISKWETKFAPIFRQLASDNCPKISYEQWFAKFVASVVWRVLLMFRQDGLLDHLLPKALVQVEPALEKWRTFMLGNTLNPGTFELHFVRFGVIESVNFQIGAPNINRYLARAIDVDVVNAPVHSFVFAKLCHCMFFGFLGKPSRKLWQGTRISPSRGTLGGRVSLVLPRGFDDYIIEKANRMFKDQKSLSPRQKEIIARSHRKNLDRTTNSETFRVLQQDVAMFGRAAFVEANQTPPPESDQ